MVGTDLERCIYCQGTAIRKEGRRRKRLETLQLWYCRSCDRTFTAQRAKGKQYPLKIILESLMLYYRGETRERTSRGIKERFGIAVPARTLSTWLAQYRELTTYARLRDECAVHFPPNRLIRSVRLHHQQVYNYRMHRGKLAAVLATPQHAAFRSLEAYLMEMATACPHRLFQSDSRASQGKTEFDLDHVEIKAKRNHACRLADLVLQTVIHHKRRHDELQRFMLATDSVTVAVEVPSFLMPEDIAAFNAERGFQVPDRECGPAQRPH